MGKYLDSAGVTTLWAKIKSLFAKKQEGIFYVEGNSTEDGKWIGTNERITSYYDGLTIAYKTNKRAGWNSTTLNINNLGAIKVKQSTQDVAISGMSTTTGTNIIIGSIIILVYATNDDGVGV